MIVGKSLKKIILIRNYLPDKQESMKRFADMLEEGFSQTDFSIINWHPLIFFGKLTNNTNSGIGKWLGYIDKWILFPLILRFRILFNSALRERHHFHICDHSNAPYLSHLPLSNTSITCHDVLAIRGALGFEDAYCPASTFGKILQKWILKSLRKAETIICVSELTKNQLLQLAPEGKSKNWIVVHNAFNAEFSPLSEQQITNTLKVVLPDMKQPFILHVGSNLARKNRKMLILMVSKLRNQWFGSIVFAGQPLEKEMIDLAKQEGVADRVFSVVKPDHKTLNALYSASEAFVFPSFSEGFGWPIIEAQACETPVIASNIDPLPEVSGGAAIHADPYKPDEFANALLFLNDDYLKSKLIKEGIENTKRFSLDTIISKYLMAFEKR